VSRAVLDVVAEALENVRRHPATRQARIDVTGSDDRIEVEVHDHGKGFDPETMPATRRGVRDSIKGRSTR
jgi:signal transduction histidine kinase